MASNNVEPMQLDMPMDDGSSAEGGDIGSTWNDTSYSSNYLVENPTLDLEFYASCYSGMAKIQRLLFIADHCTSLRVDALKMALNYIKENTFNTSLYTQIYCRLTEALKQQGLTPEKVIGQIDSAWIESRSKKGASNLEKLDTDLKNYKSNSIKESVRRGHDDLGDHYLKLGDISNALKCYSRSRDYCTSGKHVVNMCLNVIKVSIYAQNWNHVMSYVSKAEGTPEYSPNSPIGTKLHCAAGLADLANKKYKSAAKHFLAANFDHFTPDYWEILSPNNVAIYGGLCALASFNRSELHRLIITSSSFKLFLELEPQLRDAISKFYDSKYASCLSIASEMKDNLFLDIYLAPHIKILYNMIRNLALVQYFSPYLSADMNKMAAAFNTNVNALENELMQLILDGQIQARIDSHNKIIYAKDVDQRTVTFEKAFNMGKEWQKKTRALILRSAMLENGNIIVRSPPQTRGDDGSNPVTQNNHTASISVVAK
ncbi:COP9 signalosome complex subunit 1 [Tetranychus urticae]|uniref:PCI domain-containing protein n=1 Tax=Tetranychus urticae TaxID=32264 RepID=T1KPS7_TETUR|nr:COP9 signalosome complex subunit 1 [Tetranychus urticae]